jgi:pimeloyl-ACP methyl ester carboxylesterase
LAVAFASKYIDIDGTALHFLHTGPTTLPGVWPALDRGRLFVLLHPAGGSAAMWRRQLEGLSAAGDSAVALDLPGHGRSTGLGGLTTIDDGAGLVARVTHELGLRPFVLVGHSLGGALALAYGARFPTKLEGLVLVSCSSRPDLRASIDVLRKVVRGRIPQQFSPELFGPETGPDVMREFFTELVKTDPRVRLDDLQAADGFDADPLCPRVRVPTLVLAGAGDRTTEPARTEALAGAIAGARFETIAGAGHLSPQEQPDVFTRLLVEFGSRLP